MNGPTMAGICIAVLGAFTALWLTWGKKPESRPEPVKVAVNSAKAATTGNLQTFYVVRKGDTLFGIARKHGTSPEKLKNANAEKSNLIQVGQVLVIPR